MLTLALLSAQLSCGDAAKEADRALAIASTQATPPQENVAETHTAPAQTPAHDGVSRNAEQMVAAGFKRFGIEKAIIIYRLDGAMNGNEFVYFDHWGWREARYENTESRVGEYYEKIDRVNYLDGERRYVYDPQTKTAAFFDSPQIQESANKWGTKNMVTVGIEMLKNMGGEPAGTGPIQGIECEIWKIERIKTTLWMWQGITMSEQAFAMNIPVSRRAVSVETDKEIPLDKLLLPKDAKQVYMNE